MLFFLWWFPPFSEGSGGEGGTGGPAPSVDLAFRRTPRLFGPKRVAIVDE